MSAARRLVHAAFARSLAARPAVAATQSGDGRPLPKDLLDPEELAGKVAALFEPQNLDADRELRILVDEAPTGLVHVAHIASRIQGAGIAASPKELWEPILKACRASKLFWVQDVGDHIRFHAKPTEDSLASRSVYVEPLPIDADETHLRRLFEPFGKVSWIYLPRFFKSLRLKGYAFVEFECVDDAAAVCDHFDWHRSSRKPTVDSDNASVSKRSHIEDDDENDDEQQEEVDESTQGNNNTIKDEESKEKVASLSKKRSDDAIISMLERSIRTMIKTQWLCMKEEYSLWFREMQAKDTLISDILRNNTSGVMVMMKNCSLLDSKDDIKNMFKSVAMPAYIDFTPGENEGYLRFSETIQAVRAVLHFQEMPEHLPPRSLGISVRMLSVKEEEAYAENVRQQKSAKKKKLEKNTTPAAIDMEVAETAESETAVAEKSKKRQRNEDDAMHHNEDDAMHHKDDMCKQSKDLKKDDKGRGQVQKRRKGNDENGDSKQAVSVGVSEKFEDRQAQKDAAQDESSKKRSREKSETSGELEKGAPSRKKSPNALLNVASAASSSKSKNANPGASGRSHMRFDEDS